LLSLTAASADALNKAVTYLAELGRFSMAAKHLVSLAETYEKDLNDLEHAMETYERVGSSHVTSAESSSRSRWLGWFQAADYYKGEESHSSGNKALAKVAHIAAQLERYERAIELFETLGTEMVDNQVLVHLLRWRFSQLDSLSAFALFLSNCTRGFYLLTSLSTQLLKWGAKEMFLKAGLCRMCLGDFIGAKVLYDSLFDSLTLWLSFDTHQMVS
jgi:tetratricopeptide (TPR) repeat protein